MQIAPPSRLPNSGASPIENLFDVDFHLPEERRRNCVAVTLIGQQRHICLHAERFEDGFGNPVGQAVERPNQKDSVVAFVGGLQSFADAGNDFSKSRRRNVLGGFFEKGRNVVRLGHEQPGLAEDLPVAAFEPPFRPVVHPLPQILLTVWLKHPQARFGQSGVTGLHAPSAGRPRHFVISGVLQEISQVHGLEDDAAGRIEFMHAFHEKRTEPSEKIACDHHFGTR